MAQASKTALFGPGLFRLFLAVVVMVHHSLPFRAGAWAVYVFFILSGYWITRMWETRYSRTRTSYFTFVVSRWWRLAPVFLMCSLLGAVSANLITNGHVSQNLTQPAFWIRQLPVAGSSHVGRVVPPSWSLDVEMQFYLLAPLVIFAFRRMPAAIQWGVTGSLLGMLVYLLGTGVYRETAQFGIFSGLFFVGITLALTKWSPRTQTVTWTLLSFVAGTILLVLLPFTRNGVWIAGKIAQSSTEGWAVYLAAVWWAIGAALMTPFVARNVTIRSTSLDRMLGNLAYPLYLFHWIPREWYYHLSDLNGSAAVRVVLLMANFASAFGGALLILFLIDQPFDRLRARWVASRQTPLSAKDVPQPAAAELKNSPERPMQTL